MIVQTNLTVPDDLDWQVMYCQTGSSLILKNAQGQVLLSLTSIPPAKLQLLAEKINEEIAQGPMLDPVTQRRAPKGPQKPRQAPQKPSDGPKPIPEPPGPSDEVLEGLS